MRLKGLVVLVIVFALFAGCKKNNKNSNETDAAPFDKQALLINMADQVIVPNYEAFSQSLDSLILEFNSFRSKTTLNQLEIVKLKFNKAYFNYQKISPFEFGPAEENIVRMNFNVFPTDTAQILQNVATMNYNFSSASNLDAKGFPALDYLFYGKNKNASYILQTFVASDLKKQYTSAILIDMKVKIFAVLSAWKNGYRNQFINAQGTDVGSSIGFLVNQMNFELDYLKNSKIGIPLGKKTLGIVLPEKCESYYNAEQSLTFAIATLEAIESLYLGKNKTDGIGFDDYLDHLKINRDNTTLNAAIKMQFDLAKTKLKALSNNLSQQIKNNSALVDPAYMELVKLLVLLKTDLPSNLGVIITYQDGDGD